MSKHPVRLKEPYWWRMIKLIGDPVGYLDEYSSKYGDTFAVGSGGLVYIGNPEVIKAIFTADPQLFQTGRANGILKFMVGENSLLLLDGEKHQQQRKLLMPPFHGERMRSYGNIIKAIALEVTNEWQPGKPFNLRNSMQEITMKVILQAVFGINSGSRYTQLRELFTVMLDMTGSPLSSSMLFFRFLQKDWGAWSPWGKMLRRQQQIDELILAEIGERRSKPDFEGTDILSLMMAARDENGEAMSDEELLDELKTLLLAGHETTATSLCWALYLIYSLPDVQTKLLAEINNLGDNSEPATIARLPYLTAVCQETLRKYPVVLTSFPRVLNTPWKVEKYEFDAGTALLPSIYLIHHREDIYPEPQKFKPERFLNRQYEPWEYFPFGGSNRRCIGSALAMYEMKLVLATIVSNYQLKLTQNKAIKPSRRGLTVAPPGNLKMVMIGKNKQQKKELEPAI